MRSFGGSRIGTTSEIAARTERGEGGGADVTDIERLTDEERRDLADFREGKKALRIIDAQAVTLARVRALRDEHSRQVSGSVFSTALVEYLDEALDGAGAAEPDEGCECPGAHECGVTTSTVANLTRDLAAAKARIAELEAEAKDTETDIDKWVAAESAANARVAELEAEAKR
jgi:hypothetical protein